jgi:hypothetical protein
MACPNCDHTMQLVSGPMIEAGNRVWWCPRCGTIKDCDGKSTPMLVGRVVRFVGHFDTDDDAAVLMRTMGIIESIALPGQR